MEKRQYLYNTLNANLCRPSLFTVRLTQYCNIPISKSKETDQCTLNDPQVFYTYFYYFVLRIRVSCKL
jgi:hypothetical protein